MVRWITPQNRQRALVAMHAAGLSSDAYHALWIELAQLAVVPVDSWLAMGRLLSSWPGDFTLTAHALSRLTSPDAFGMLREMRDHRVASVHAGSLCALMALGEPHAATQAWSLQLAGLSFSRQLYLRATLLDSGEPMEDRLSALWQSGLEEESILAVGASGAAHLLPALIASMDDAAFARPAGRVFELITGYFPATPAQSDENAVRPPGSSNRYVHLRKPDSAVASEWLHGPGRDLPCDVPLLRGIVRSAENCLLMLRNGDCVDRMCCAEFLLMNRPEFVGLDIQAPMFDQVRHPAMSAEFAAALKS